MSASSGVAPGVARGAATVIDPDAVRTLLARHLPAGDDARITSCRVVRSRVRSGARALVQYAVGVARPTRHDELRVTVQWHADPLRAARHRRHARTAADAVTSWTHPLPPAIGDDATGLLATTFPCDLRLTGLAAVVAGDSPALVAPMCAWAGLAPADVAGIDVDTVRYREQLSAVCRYTLRVTQGDAPPPFYVKVFADDSGARAALRLDALAVATARIAGAARVDPALTWVADLRALVLPAAPGTPLDVALAAASPAHRESLLRLVAAALARFAAATPALNARRTRDDLAGATTRALEAIARLLPAERGLAVLGTTIAARLPGDVIALTHGDLKLEHVLIDDATVRLIDLDSCHLGDPRWDLALVAARCDADRLRAGDTDAVGADWPVLADAYLGGGGPAADARGLRALRAAAWVDVAAGVLKRHEDGAAAHAARLLDRARREVTAS